MVKRMVFIGTLYFGEDGGRGRGFVYDGVLDIALDADTAFSSPIVLTRNLTSAPAMDRAYEKHTPYGQTDQCCGRSGGGNEEILPCFSRLHRCGLDFPVPILRSDHVPVNQARRAPSAMMPRSNAVHLIFDIFTK
jgi:hypothetical protein